MNLLIIISIIFIAIISVAIWYFICFNVNTLKNKDTLNWEKEVKWQAHKYWEEAGYPEGRDLEFWLKAEEKCKEYFR